MYVNHHIERSKCHTNRMYTIGFRESHTNHVKTEYLEPIPAGSIVQRIHDYIEGASSLISSLYKHMACTIKSFKSQIKQFFSAKFLLYISVGLL